jgi:hypothetical protein
MRPEILKPVEFTRAIDEYREACFEMEALLHEQGRIVMTDAEVMRLDDLKAVLTRGYATLYRVVESLDRLALNLKEVL